MRMLLVLVLFLSPAAFADEPLVFSIVLRNHRFEPSTLKVPAKKKFKLEVKNEDAGTEEFESNVLNIEKFVGPKKTLRLVLGPLEPGRYPFFGEFHSDTAKGEIVAE